MNVLHLLTTGTSLLNEISRRSQDDYQAVADALLPTPDAPGDTRAILQAARDAAGVLDLDRLLSPEQRERLAEASEPDATEWSSVHAVRRDRDFPDADAESFVFLASDTDEGVRAAALLAVKYQPSALRYVPEPLAHGESIVCPGEAWICRIPQLDLGWMRPSARTWRSLGAAGRLVVQTARNNPANWTVLVHYSGGYKAVVPYVIVLAEAIRSALTTNKVPVRAVALHEVSVKRGQPIVVEVPVRALAEDLWRQVKVLRDAMSPNSEQVRCDAAPLLRGLMLETVDANWEAVTAPGLISTHVL